MGDGLVGLDGVDGVDGVDGLVGVDGVDGSLDLFSDLSKCKWLLSEFIAMATCSQCSPVTRHHPARGSFGTESEAPHTPKS